MKAAVKGFAVVFALWTLVALCGGFADYLLSLFLEGHARFWATFRRPLTEQWIWAGLTPLVFFLAHRFPLAHPRLARAIALHVAAFLSLSVLHCVVAGLVGGPLAVLPVHYPGPTLPLRFLEELYSDIWMYWPLVCIQALLDSHERARAQQQHAAELEKLFAQSRLAFLRAQIQPHFLFNTLHALSALIRTDAPAAEDMVADLAEILRACSADSSLQEITLRRELDLVSCYLRIQQRRLGERLTVHQVVAPELLNAAVPALVLQSIVENAVIHGIAPLDRNGTVEIEIYRQERWLVLHVEDDGPGIQSTGRTGLGIANARRRLRELYGAHQLLDISSTAGHGVCAMLYVPFRILPANMEKTGDYPHSHSGRRAAGETQLIVSAGA